MAVTLDAPARPQPLPRSTRGARLAAGLVVLVAVFVAVCCLSIALGARGIALGTVWQALTDFDPASAPETVVREMRVPRTLLAVTVGAALGLSGTILQGVTRNPLADPGIMGINAGAATAVVAGIMRPRHRAASSTYIWLAFLGAGAATVAVYAIASFGREGATPVKLALAGAAVTAGLTSLTTAIVMTARRRAQRVAVLAGRVARAAGMRRSSGRRCPSSSLGTVVALGAGRALNGLALGDDVARALGQRVRLTRLRALRGGRAAVRRGDRGVRADRVPRPGRAAHRAHDLRPRLPLDPALRAGARRPSSCCSRDIVGRLVLTNGELQVGVVLGVLGAPAFIALVRYRNLAEL